MGSTDESFSNTATRLQCRGTVLSSQHRTSISHVRCSSRHAQSQPLPSKPRQPHARTSSKAGFAEKSLRVSSAWRHQAQGRGGARTALCLRDIETTKRLSTTRRSAPQIPWFRGPVRRRLQSRRTWQHRWRCWAGSPERRYSDR